MLIRISNQSTVRFVGRLLSYYLDIVSWLRHSSAFVSPPVQVLLWHVLYLLHSRL